MAVSHQRFQPQIVAAASGEPNLDGISPRQRASNNAGMDDKATKRGSGEVVAILVVVVLLLPLLYVLSVGPAAWLHGSGWLSAEGRSTLETAYFPVKWTAQNVAVIGPVIEKYANWCEGDRAVSLVPYPSS